MPQVDLKLNSSFDGSGFNQLQAEADKLGRAIQRKLTLPDLGKSILSGLGLGSGFAVANLAFEKWAGLFREIEADAKSVAEYVDDIHRKAGEIARMRFDNFLGGLTPKNQLVALNEQLGKIDERIANAKKRQAALASDLDTAARAPRGTITGTAFDPFGGRYGSFGTMKGVGDTIETELKKAIDDEMEATKERLQLERQIAAAKKAVAEEGKKDAEVQNRDLAGSVKNYLDNVLKPTLSAEIKLHETRTKAAAATKLKKDEEAATAAIRAAQDAVEKYDTALQTLEANPYLTDFEKQRERVRLIELQTQAIKDQKKALDDFAAAHPGVDVGGLTAARDRLGDKATAAGVDLYRAKNRPSRVAQDATALRGLGDPSQHYQSAGEGALGGVMSWLQQVGTLGDQVAGHLANAFTSAAAGISQSIQGLINGTMTWRDALMNIGTTVIQSIIQAFADMVAQWIVKQIVMAVAGKAIQAATVAAMVPVAMAASAIWAPPATLATIATMGGAAAAAPGQIALSKIAVMLQSLSGFEAGGFPAGRNALIRVNENGQEAVLNADATAALGHSWISEANAGRLHPITRPGYAPAGSAGAAGAGGYGGFVGVTVIDGRDHAQVERVWRDPRSRRRTVEIYDQQRKRWG